MTLISYDDFLVTGPTREPLDLDEVKKHLRFGPTTEDTLIDTGISWARQYFELRTQRQLLTATWARTVNLRPSGAISLPMMPLQSVVSISSDDGGTPSVMDASGYSVVAPTGPFAGPGRVEVTGGWPGTRGRIEYRAGYGDAPGDVPELIKGCLLMLVAHFHKFRSEGHEGPEIVEPPMNVRMIMQLFRYKGVSTIAPMRTVPTTWP